MHKPPPIHVRKKSKQRENNKGGMTLSGITFGKEKEPKWDAAGGREGSLRE